MRGKMEHSPLLWALRLAWRIDKKMISFWVVCNCALCILPSVALVLNRQIIGVLSAFLETGDGTFASVLPTVLLYGAVFTVSGLSARLNKDFLYFRMYDSYYLGMQETMMDFMQKMPMELLFRKDVNDEYNSIIRRAGSLTDLMSSICQLIAKFVGVFAMLIPVAAISRPVVLMIVCYIVVMLLVSRRITDRLRVYETGASESERRLNYITNIPMEPGVAKELRVYENKQSILKQWDRYYTEVEKQQMLYHRNVEVFGAVNGISLYLFMALVLFYCLFQISDHRVTIEQFLMLFVLCGSLSAYIGQIAKGCIVFDRGLFALQRQKRFMEQVQEAIDEQGRTHEPGGEVAGEASLAVFQVRDLHYAYGDRKEVLRGIDLEIHRGQVVALVGENGSGKSTLVHLLTGLYQPTKGTVERHGTMGTFFQDCYLFHKTLWENIGLGNVDFIQDRQLIRQAIYKGGADSLVARLPDGEETLLRKEVFPEGTELSGGEQQKIGVARAHMGHHDILIFDEPAAALDPVAEMLQFQRIQENLQDSTAILISHRVGFARLADRILVMENGRIAEDGSHEALMEKGGLYAEIFCRQAQWYDKEEAAHE